MNRTVNITSMEDYEQELKRINAEVAELRLLYGMEHITLEQRAERYQMKQAIATVRPPPKWNI